MPEDKSGSAEVNKDPILFMKRQIALRKELRRRWMRSPWRLIPLPVLAYVVTASYLWAIHVPDALFRAVGPVLTVMSFTIAGPLIRYKWHRKMRERIKKERSWDQR